MRLVLLLTRDRAFENLLTGAVRENGATVLIARNVAEALRIVCRRIRDLDLAVIDLDRGCRGLTLLSAIKTCRPGIRVLVLASSNTYRSAALAYANGAAASLAKPISAAELETVISHLDETKPALTIA